MKTKETRVNYMLKPKLMSWALKIWKPKKQVKMKTTQMLLKNRLT